MKRRIIIGLTVYAVIFTLGGLYLLRVINFATERLDRLVQLHQVEILREHYLLKIRRVQSDLTLEGTRHERGFETMVSHAVVMRNLVDTCFTCHHEEEVLDRIRQLRWQTQLYQDALSRVLTMRANEARLAEEQNAAFLVGEELISQVGEMIALTGTKLESATQDSLQEINDTRFALYMLVGIAPLFSVVLGYIFVASLTSPVKVLLGSTRKLKAGDLDHRVPELTHEFGELADAFNEMAASLKEQMHEMQRTEQLAVVGELAAGLGHEIKNPLAGIKVAMDVLGTEAYLSDEDREVVKRVSHEITRLEVLMRSFLDFARPAKPRFESVSINTVINTTLALYSGRHRRAGDLSPPIEVQKELSSLPRTAADSIQLQQVFLNLVINAVEVMPDGGTLTVRSSLEQASGDVIVVTVGDTGKGIAPEHLDSIFQPFFTTKPKGTGLGLPTCRQLVEQHGGTITVTENPGGGTVFSVRLPVRAVIQDGVS